MRAIVGPRDSFLPALPPRLWSLDALRGICALLVFLSHWHLWSNFTPAGTVQSFVRSFGDNIYQLFVTLTWPTGAHHPAVICFFVLSGFCIHYPRAQRTPTERPPNWADYYLRRFKRIYPVFWLAALMGLGFVALQKIHPAPNPLLDFHASATPLTALIRLTGWEGLYPEEIIAGNYILVTVAAEMVMYLLYPLLHWFTRAQGWGRATAVLVVLHLASLGFLALGVTPFWVFNSPFMLGIFWFAGAAAAHLFVQGRLATHAAWLVGAWLLFLGLKLIPHFYGLNLLKQAGWGLVCVFGLPLVLALERQPGVTGASRPARTLRYLGRLSYSLYAVHTPAIMLASWTLLVLFSTRSYPVQLATTLAFSATATLAVHHLVERRFYPLPPT